MRPAAAVKHLAHTGQSSLRTDSLRDVGDRLEQIGLSPKTGWYVSIGLYAAGGIPAIVVHLIDPRNYNAGFLVLGAMAVVISLLSILGLRYFPMSHRATHVRLTVGGALILTGAFIVGGALQAFILLALVVSIPPAVYYGLRPAAFYMLLCTLFAAIAAISINEPWAPALAICSAFTLFTLSVSMMVAQFRTRAFARRHRELAFTDALTGLANTRALNTALRHELDDPDNLRAALFAIDLDDFKQVNDRFDHQRGDEVLKAVAEALVSRGMPGDLFARRGGDEFSLLVGEPRDRDLGVLADELGEAIAEARKRVCPEVSPSGSVAYVYARPDDTVGSILQRADDALHAAKVEYHSHDAGNRPVRLAIIDQRSESDRARGELLSAESHPARRASDRDNGETGGRLRGVAHIDRPLWRFAAALNAALSLPIAVVALGGLARPLTPVAGAAIAAGMIVLAGLSLLAAARPLPADGIHVVFVASAGLLCLSIALAHSAGAAMIDLLAVTAVFAFHLFRSKVAACYLPLFVAAFAGFSIGRGFPYAGAHLVVFTSMVASTAALTAKVRQVTNRYIEDNWRLSQIDALTGLSNVRALRARVKEAVRTAAGGGPRPTLLAIDLDEFKMVNDSFSHTVGDQVLVSVARAIADNVRVEDMAARRGGDEFVVVTDAEDETELKMIADRVREAIERSRRRICPQLLATSSIAVVHWRDADDADAFMHRADVGLHEQKLASRSGRSADAG